MYPNIVKFHDWFQVPLEGFGSLQGMRGVQRFSIHKAYGESGLLPTAHTCFNQACIALYCTVLYCTALHCTAYCSLYCIVLYCIAHVLNVEDCDSVDTVSSYYLVAALYLFCFFSSFLTPILHPPSHYSFLFSFLPLHSTLCQSNSWTYLCTAVKRSYAPSY